MNNTQSRNDLLKIFESGVERVKGRFAVHQHLLKHPLNTKHIHLVAIGKASSSMSLGAFDVCGHQISDGIVITKRDHLEAELTQHSSIQCIESDHPLPSSTSITAGQALLDYLAKYANNGETFLFLLSGGASSLVEVLADGCDLNTLKELTQLLLAHGYDIQQINKIRRAVSKIKGGRLVNYLNGADAQVLLISDVPGDDPAIIGSGLLTPIQEAINANEYTDEIHRILQSITSAPTPTPADFSTTSTQIIARLQDAKDQCLQTAQQLGYDAQCVDRFIEGDTITAAKTIADEIMHSDKPMRIYGGETSLILPPHPGAGGRNQHFALSAAQAIEGHNICILSAGTDGTDGPTDSAGGLVDGHTIARGCDKDMSAQEYLDKANSHEFLQATGDIVHTGPTGTNVMDLIIALKEE